MRHEEQRPDSPLLNQLKIIQEKGCVAPEYVLEQLIRAEYTAFSKENKRFPYPHYRLTELGKAMLKQLEEANNGNP